MFPSILYAGILSDLGLDMDFTFCYNHCEFIRADALVCVDDIVPYYLVMATAGV